MNKRLKLSEAQRFGIRFFTLLIAVSVLSWAVKLPAALVRRSADWRRPQRGLRTSSGARVPFSKIKSMSGQCPSM